VKESNNIARARISPSSSTVWDERIISAIAARNTIDDTEFQEHKLDLRTLYETKKLSTLQFTEAKRAIRDLARKTFEIPNGHRGISVFPIFARLEINDDGVITGCLNPKLKPHYLELRQQFSIRSLPDFQALSSTYSQKLYRFLCSWRGLPEVTISLAELHHALDVPQSFKADFRNFRIRVLDVAHREISAVALKSTEKKPLEFDWEPIREGRQKVTAVRFVFDRLEAQETAKNQPEDALSIHIKLQRESNRCFERIVIHDQRKCTPEPQTAKCKFCLERGRMYAQKIVMENQGKFQL
jgi:plasmid replication initiation protein